MRLLLHAVLCLSLCAAVATPAAGQLVVAEVSAPQINCFFDLDCSVTSDDSTGTFSVPFASGRGELVSRLWPTGEPGTEGEGVEPDLYRVDLGGVTASFGTTCVTRVVLPFAPFGSHGFDHDGERESVFVITGGGGGVGSVAPSSVRSATSPPRLILHFSPGVCADRSGGESSFYVGFVTRHGAGPDEADLTFSGGWSGTAAVQVPQE